MHRRFVFIFCVLILAACQSSNETSNPPAPSVEVPALQTSVVETVFVTATKTASAATPIPNVTSTTTVTPKPSSISGDAPAPETSRLFSDIRAAFAVETLEAFDGHAFTKLTGWKDGLSFEWVDSNRLLVGASAYDNWIHYPVMLDLETNKFWLPEITTHMVNFSGSAYYYKYAWSHKLNRLISSNFRLSGDVTELYDLDGKLVQSYPGQFRSVSPSGTRILTNDTWLDLTTGKTFAFADWDLNIMIDLTPRRIVWSPDELSVMGCCYVYGNATTGQNFRFDMPGYPFDSTDGKWMLNQTYFIPLQGLTPPYVPAFVPAKKTVLNVSKLAGIPQLQSDQSSNTCSEWSPSPDERHILIACDDGGYLVDLSNFARQAYPVHFNIGGNPPIWSPNGKFAAITTFNSGMASYILSVASKKLIPLPEGYNYCDWAPTGNSLLCSFWDEHTISIFDTQTGTITRSFTLPFVGYPVAWSPDGNYAAIASLDRDNIDYSLWQIDYPALENLKQLTPALPAGENNSYITNAVWSPDGVSLAFNFGPDIYVVDTHARP